MAVINKFEILASLWTESLDMIVANLLPQELFIFANTSKKNCYYVKDFLKRIKSKYIDESGYTYGFSIEKTDAGDKLNLILPHKNCLIKILNNNDNYMDQTGYSTALSFGSIRHSAFIRIVKIKRISDCSFKLYGWVLSGKGIHMMRNDKGGLVKKYFRPYPLWSFITISNYNRFEIVPYK
jgi:hypothetical protein